VIWKDVYSIVDGKLALIDKVYANVIPAHIEQIDEQIVWPTKK